MPIRILIADDHSVVRKGIRMLLEDETDLEIVGEAVDGEEAVRLIPEVRPNVLLLDITMPRMSGIEVAQTVAKHHPSVRVLIFSMHHNPDYILSAVQCGAAGYIPKDTGEDELLRAIRTVASGELYYTPNVSSVIIRHWVKPKAAPEESTGGNSNSVWKRLTQREAQILTCLTEGLSSRDIASRFDISPNTVANQRASIMRKAGVKNTAELVKIALKDSPRA